MPIIEGLITRYLLTPCPLSTLERGDTLCIGNDSSLRNLMEAIPLHVMRLAPSPGWRGAARRAGVRTKKLPFVCRTKEQKKPPRHA